MSRTDGRKLVAFAGAAIVGALGIGEIIVQQTNFVLGTTCYSSELKHTSTYSNLLLL